MGDFYADEEREDISTVLSVQLSPKEVYDYSHPGYLLIERERRKSFGFEPFSFAV